MPRAANYVLRFRDIIKDPEILNVISNEAGDINYPKSKSAEIEIKIVQVLTNDGYKINNNTIYSRIRQAENLNELLGNKKYPPEKPESDNNRTIAPEQQREEEEDNFRSTITLTEIQINAIFPVSRKVDGRTRTYPKEDWTNTVQDLLSTSLKFPCAFRFKFISVSNVFCSAECGECKLLVHTYLKDDSEGQKVMLAKIINTADESILHKKSRQIRGNLRNLDLKDSAVNQYNQYKLQNAHLNGKIEKKTIKNFQLYFMFLDFQSIRRR